jgi:hypothetical protein
MTIDMKTLLASALALAAVIAVPGAASAATYAFVNTAGEVMTMEATNSDVALATAPNLHVHSGVMLVGADDADVIGDEVPGT